MKNVDSTNPGIRLLSLLFLFCCPLAVWLWRNHLTSRGLNSLNYEMITLDLSMILMYFMIRFFVAVSLVVFEVVLNTTERLHFHFSLSCIGEGNDNPLQCSCLENPRDGGACWAAVYGVAQSRTRLKWLSSSSSRWSLRVLASLIKFSKDFRSYVCLVLYREV